MTPILYLDSTLSTNDTAKEMARQGAEHGTAVSARQQTGGRGRMGRRFLSPCGGAYLSVIFRPQRPAAELMHLTAVLAVAACDAVEEVAGIRPGIKWTNDLVLDGKKLGGILTELSLTGDGQAEFAVCGVGINCTAPMEEFSPEVRQIVTGLSETDPGLLTEALYRHLLKAGETAVSDRFRWMEKYRQDCVTLQKTVQVLGSDPYTAFALDVDGDGALLVRTEDGEIRKVCSGEVSVRGLYGYV